MRKIIGAFVLSDRVSKLKHVDMLNQGEGIGLLSLLCIHSEPIKLPNSVVKNKNNASMNNIYPQCVFWYVLRSICVPTTTSGNTL